jgi:hypothetical protein
VTQSSLCSTTSAVTRRVGTRLPVGEDPHRPRAPLYLLIVEPLQTVGGADALWEGQARESVGAVGGDENAHRRAACHYHRTPEREIEDGGARVGPIQRKEHKA